MSGEKRNPRSYKVRDSTYNKAMKRAGVEKFKLATILENVVEAYSKGLDIKAVKNEQNGGTALDIFSENFSIRLNELTANR